jgi:MurNAc alpha-1-phosphate uridylyltransferase
MILSAGEGRRMLPLTKERPKPLLKVGGRPLIVWHIERLVELGFVEIIINIAYLGYMIKEYLGDGERYGISIVYSDEQIEGGLETAGGIIKALPLLGDNPFLVINGDIWCDYPYNPLFDLNDSLAHLILVPNPSQHRDGDFALVDSRIKLEGEELLTFSGVGYYTPKLFDSIPYGRLPLAPILRELIAKDRISGEYYGGEWRDIGTPHRLEELHRELNSRAFEKFL